MKHFFLLLILFTAGSYSQNLAPDATFGINGVANTDVLFLRYIHLAANNKIYTLQSNLEGVVCYNSDGSPDTAFGENGSIDFIPQFGMNGVGTNHDTNGIVSNAAHVFAYGYFHPQFSDNDNIFIAKMDFDGNLDATFGTDGVAMLDYGQKERMWSAQLTPSGKILCIGWRDIPGQRKMILMMLNSDGSKDLSFGTDGLKEYILYSGVTFAEGVVQGDNCFYIACVGNNGAPAQSCIIKIDMNGNLMPGFGDNGILQFDTTHFEDIPKLFIRGKNLYAHCHYYSDSGTGNDHILRVYDLVEEEVTLTLPLTVSTGTSDFYVKPDGRIMTYGFDYCSTDCFTTDVHLAQYTPEGNLDTSFNTTGHFDFNFDTVNGSDTWDLSGQLYELDDSKILVSGMYFVNGFPNVTHLVMARFTQGSLGVGEQMENHLSLYPNPAADELNLSFKEIAFPVTVSVNNILGQTTMTKEYTSAQGNSLSIDVGTLPSGLYVVKVKDDTAVEFTEKFLKQ